MRRFYLGRQSGEIDPDILPNDFYPVVRYNNFGTPLSLWEPQANTAFLRQNITRNVPASSVVWLDLVRWVTPKLRASWIPMPDATAVRGVVRAINLSGSANVHIMMSWAWYFTDSNGAVDTTLPYAGRVDDHFLGEYISRNAYRAYYMEKSDLGDNSFYPFVNWSYVGGVRGFQLPAGRRMVASLRARLFNDDSVTRTATVGVELGKNSAYDLPASDGSASERNPWVELPAVELFEPNRVGMVL